MVISAIHSVFCKIQAVGTVCRVGGLRAICRSGGIKAAMLALPLIGGLAQPVHAFSSVNTVDETRTLGSCEVQLYYNGLDGDAYLDVYQGSDSHFVSDAFFFELFYRSEDLGVSVLTETVLTDTCGVSVDAGSFVTVFDDTTWSGASEISFRYDYAGTRYYYAVTDGSYTVSSTALNSRPTISGTPSSISVTTDTASNVDLSAATVSDADGDSLTVTLSVDAGTLSASSGGGVTVGGTSTAMTLAGTAANIDTYLNTASNIQYTTASGVSGDSIATLTIAISDGTIGLSSNPTVTINAVLPDPVITSATYNSGTGVLVITGTDFVANGAGADVDVSKLTITGEGGASYTLTSPGVEITGDTAFSITLSTADKLHCAAPQPWTAGSWIFPALSR